MKHLIIALVMLGAVDSSYAGCFGTAQKSLNKALIAAVQEVDIPKVKNLIEHGANVNTKDNYGMTALCHAAKTGSEELVKVLIEHNVDVNLTNTDSHTPLAYSIFLKFNKISHQLIEAGANLNVTIKQANYLHLAARSGNAAAMKILIDTGKFSIDDINALSSDQTPLISAIMAAMTTDTAEPDILEIVKTLHAAGADITSTHDNFTPLSYAKLANKPTIEKWLISAGADESDAKKQMDAYHEENRQFRIAEAKKSSGPSGSGSAPHSSDPTSEALRAAKILKNGYDLGTFIGQVLQ